MFQLFEPSSSAHQAGSNPPSLHHKHTRSLCLTQIAKQGPSEQALYPWLRQGSTVLAQMREKRRQQKEEESVSLSLSKALFLSLSLSLAVCSGVM